MRRDGLPVKNFAGGRQFEAMTLALKQRHAQAIPDLPRYARRRDIEPAGALAAVRIPSKRGIGDVRAAGFRSSSDLNDRAAALCGHDWSMVGPFRRLTGLRGLEIGTSACNYRHADADAASSRCRARSRPR